MKKSPMPPGRQFPVMWPHDRKTTQRLNELKCPKSVDWSLVEPHETAAYMNHSQTLERLAERGGLAPNELVAVLTDRPLRYVLELDNAVAALLLLKIIHERSDQTKRTP